MSDNNVTAVTQGSILTPPPDRQGTAGGAHPTHAELPYRELFLAVAELLPEAVYTKDLQGRYTFINSAGARYLGLSIPEILGRKDSELMTPEEAQNTLEFDRQTLLAGRTLHAEMTEFLGGVRREWVSTKGIVRRPDGQVVGLFGISRDLSDHRRSEAVQLQSEALFRATSNSSFDAFFLLREDPDGLRLLRLNSHGEALLGCQATEAEGGLFTEFPQANFIAPPQLCQEVWRTGKPHDEEVEQVLPQGRRWFRRQLNAVGNCMAVMMRDITRLRENELRLRLNERMAAIGMLAAGVAHEINNPLAFVRSNLHFLQKELLALPLPSEVRGEFEEVLTETRTGLDRIQQIVADLRGFSRMDVEEPSPCLLADVVDNAVRLAGVRLKHVAHVKVEVPRELPSVFAVSRRLVQVLLNLLVNAGDAIEESGREGGTILVRGEVQDAHVVLTVEDDGPGFPPEVLPRLFETFFTTKGPEKGTGLGLVISRELLAEFGATLSAENRAEGGARLRIVFP